MTRGDYLQNTLVKECPMAVLVGRVYKSILLLEMLLTLIVVITRTKAPEQEWLFLIVDKFPEIVHASGRNSDAS